MRIILELDKTILEKLQQKAAMEKRSRKNYMETILQNIAEDKLIFGEQANGKIGIDEYKKSEIVHKQQVQSVIKNWQYYMNLIPELKTVEGCTNLNLEIQNNSLLFPNEKKILQGNLITHSKTLFND